MTGDGNKTPGPVKAIFVLAAIVIAVFIISLAFYRPISNILHNWLIN